jgi:hypothetical protein
MLNSFYSLGDPLLVCSLPWHMHFYRLLLSCNNTPLFWLPLLPCLQNSWEHFSCIRGYLILSVAWQWVFHFGLPDNMSQYLASYVRDPCKHACASLCAVSLLLLDVTRNWNVPTDFIKTRFRTWARIFHRPTVSRLAVGPIQPPIQWVGGASHPWV